MTHKTRVILPVAALIVTVVATTAFVTAQDFFRPRRSRGGGEMMLPPDRNGVPTWQVDAAFKSDVFTFVRIRYSSSYNGGRRRGGGGNGWSTDWPDSDLNFPFRLQQLTSLKVAPEPIILDLTDEKLSDYPFIYMIEPGSLEFTEEEVVALRKYLFNGGFLMVDDFWGDREWDNFYEQIKRVFPEQEPQDLELDHPIFHCVFNLKEKPQVPSISWAYHGDPSVTTDRPYDAGSRDVHYRAFYDDKGRMVSIICHNTDLGDGWEREGESEAYFHQFSEKRAYPMGVNIVFYAMTH